MSQPLISLDSVRFVPKRPAPLPETPLPDTFARVDFVALMVTRRCNMSCGHCSVESSPHVKDEPSLPDLKRLLAQAKQSGVKGVLLTGGEATIYLDTTLALIREVKALGMGVALTSNGFWGKTPEGAERTVARFVEAELGQITISYDRYHAQFQGPEAVRHIAAAAQKHGLPMYVSVTRTAQDGDLTDLLAPLADVTYPGYRFYDVQPVGRAKTLERDALRGELDGFCNACIVPALTEDGRVTACNGPSYFSPPHSPLSIGNLRDEPLDTLLRRHREDPILNSIRAQGPMHLRDLLLRDPEFAHLKEREFSGMCDLCLTINSDARAVEILRAELEDPATEARRVAHEAVICGLRMGGELSRDHINGLGAARLFWRMAREDDASAWADDATRLFGRADFDWARWARHLVLCGLATPLQNALQKPEFARWAPSCFVVRLSAAARGEAFRALMQREALRRINGHLLELGAEALALKGTAQLLQDAVSPPPKGAHPGRVSGDVDILVAPRFARELHERLRGDGFVGPRSRASKWTHQLEPLAFEGVSIEIHQTVLHGVCGLPDRVLLPHTRPVGGAWSQFRMLSPEAALLHSGVHLVNHQWMFGLKTAWDAAWHLDRFPNFRAASLQEIAQKCGLERSFWMAIGQLTRDFELPFSSDTIPTLRPSRLDARLEGYGKRVLYGQSDSPCEGRPGLYYATRWAGSDSLSYHARLLTYMATIATWDKAKRTLHARRANVTASTTASSTR